jgi:hypothetical protein
MSRKQRLTFLGIAAIIAAVAVIVLSGGEKQTERAATPTAAPTAPGGPAATATATPKPKPPPLLQAGKEKTLTFTQGKTARFRVRHDEAEQVHIHGYDIAHDLEPGVTKTVAFKATIAGIFEVELEHSGTPLGRLKVQP